ncbi:ZNF581, partial [Symbiodinium sp. CCMP2592]
PMVACPECGKVFKFPSQLQRHRDSVHLKLHERPHECHLCGYRCHKAADLRKHLSSHEKKRKLGVPREDCVASWLEDAEIQFQRGFRVDLHDGQEPRFARIDFLIRQPWGLVALEVDELQHKLRDGDREARRLRRIRAALPVVKVVRYNPDEFTVDGQPGEVTGNERHRRLMSSLAAAPEDGFEEVFLFFDQEQPGGTSAAVPMSQSAGPGLEQGSQEHRMVYLIDNREVMIEPRREIFIQGFRQGLAAGKPIDVVAVLNRVLNWVLNREVLNEVLNWVLNREVLNEVLNWVLNREVLNEVLNWVLNREVLNEVLNWVLNREVLNEVLNRVLNREVLNRVLNWVLNREVLNEVLNWVLNREVLNWILGSSKQFAALLFVAIMAGQKAPENNRLNYLVRLLGPNGPRTLSDAERAKLSRELQQLKERRAEGVRTRRHVTAEADRTVDEVRRGNAGLERRFDRVESTLAASSDRLDRILGPVDQAGSVQELTVIIQLAAQKRAEKRKLDRAEDRLAQKRRREAELVEIKPDEGLMRRFEAQGTFLYSGLRCRLARCEEGVATLQLEAGGPEAIRALEQKLECFLLIFTQTQAPAE